MQAVRIFFLSGWFGLIPTVIQLCAFAAVASAHFYFRKNEATEKWFLRIFVFMILFRVFYAALSTFGQWYVWRGNEIGLYFLRAPSEVWPRLGYFVFYVFGHFWLSVLLSIVLAAIIFVAGMIAHHYRPAMISKTETILIGACAAILGWPLGALGLCATLIIALLHILYLKLGGRRAQICRVRIELSALIATALMLVFGRLIVV